MKKSRISAIKSKCQFLLSFFFFFFNAAATTDLYTLSLHDALPISLHRTPSGLSTLPAKLFQEIRPVERDRKSTRLNSSHVKISYAVFCLKKKMHRSIVGIEFLSRILTQSEVSWRSADVHECQASTH